MPRSRAGPSLSSLFSSGGWSMKIRGGGSRAALRCAGTMRASSRPRRRGDRPSLAPAIFVSALIEQLRFARSRRRAAVGGVLAVARDRPRRRVRPSGRASREGEWAIGPRELSEFHIAEPSMAGRPDGHRSPVSVRSVRSSCAGQPRPTPGRPAPEQLHQRPNHRAVERPHARWRGVRSPRADEARRVWPSLTPRRRSTSSCSSGSSSWSKPLARAVRNTRSSPWSQCRTGHDREDKR